MQQRTDHTIHEHDRPTSMGHNPRRYDILAQVMFMSRFRLAPKIGRLERMKRIYGYLAKTKQYAIRYRTKEPDYSHHQNLTMNEQEQFVAMLKKRSQKMYLNHWEKE